MCKLLQAYDKKFKKLYDIVKTDSKHYMLRNEKGWLTGPIDKTKPQLIKLLKSAKYQVF